MALLPDNETVYLDARHSNHGGGPLPCGRVVGHSTDGGEHWNIEYNSSHSPPDTRSPSPTSLLRLPNGALLMALPTADKHDDLAIFASFDGGLGALQTIRVLLS